MNRKEFVKKIANDLSLAQSDVNEVINKIPDVVKEVVGSGEKIVLNGFMTFEKRHVDARSGISRIDGSKNKWEKPAKDIVVAKLSKKYKEL